MRNAQNLPADKPATPEEQAQRDFYHNNEDSIYSPGIRVGEEGFYDPQAGAEKHPINRPQSESTPILATDPGQPKGVGAHVISRELNAAVDRSEASRTGSSGTVDKTEKPVVRSSGRKATTKE